MIDGDSHSLRTSMLRATMNAGAWYRAYIDTAKFFENILRGWTFRSISYLVQFLIESFVLFSFILLLVGPLVDLLKKLMK